MDTSKGTGGRAHGVLRESGKQQKESRAFRITWAGGQTTGQTAGPTAGPAEQSGPMTPEPTCAFRGPPGFCQLLFLGENSV